MSRDVTAGLIGTLDDTVIYPFFAVELNFDGANVLRMWTGLGTLSLNGFDWVGTGAMLSVSSIDETSSIQAVGATLTLSGVPSDVISLALNEPYQGRVCNIYFGSTVPAGTEVILPSYSAQSIEPQIVGDFVEEYFWLESAAAEIVGAQYLTQIFSGYMDEMNISEGPDTSTIELKVENKLIDLERARVARFTSGYQKSIYPLDKGLDFIESMQDQKLPWGKTTELPES